MLGTDETKLEGERGQAIAGALRVAVDDQKKILSRLSRDAKILAGSWSDPKVVDRASRGVEAAAGRVAPGISDQALELVRRAESWLKLEKQGRRQRLATELREGCASRHLEMKLVSKEPLEIRIPPLGVEIDVPKNRAHVTFGKVRIQESKALAEDIFDARKKALKELERGSWTPEGFHGALLGAWRAAMLRAGEAGGGWVELSSLLPHVAVAMQDARWMRDPTSRNFRSYGKAQFLYDLHRMRSAGILSLDGQRLVLGVATGDSTRDKKRVFWVENGQGEGSYHLTLKFVREERIHAQQDGEAHV